MRDANKFFEYANNQSRKHSSWTSDRVFNASMQAYTRQQEDSDEDRARRLGERQSRLVQLLAAEAKHNEEELKRVRQERRLQSGGNVGALAATGVALSSRPANDLDVLRTRVDGLRQTRETERKRLADEKLYEQWRANNSDIRELESRRMQERVVDEWADQVRDKENAVRMRERDDAEYVRYLEEEKERALARDVELTRLKQTRAVELKEILKEQMIEVKQREAESEVLSREEAEVMRDMQSIEMVREERARINERRLKEEHGRQLLRQHKAALRKRAKEVQDAIEFDLGVLKVLKEREARQVDNLYTFAMNKNKK